MGRFIAFALALTLFAACDKKDAAKDSGKTGGSDSSATPAKAPGGSSPQEVFDQARAASERKDWKGMFVLMDPEQTDMSLFGVSMMAGMTAEMDKGVEPELEALFKKHAVGIDKDHKVTMTGKKEENEKAVKEAFKNVKDKPALFADMVEFIGKHDKDKKGGGMMEMQGETLKEVKIEGDKATGTVTKKDGNTSSAKFVKRQDRWYFSMD